MRNAIKIIAAAVLLVALGLLSLIYRPAPEPPPTASSPAPAPAPTTTVPQALVSPPPAPRPPTTAGATPAPTEKPTPPPRQGGYARLRVKTGEPIPELFPYQAEREHLLALATKGDPDNIPVIADGLKHPDATVRETARQALLQLGDARAVPALRAAAKKTRDQEEAALLNEAADFLALPSAH